MTFEEQVKALLEAQDADGLLALGAEASSKAERKSVKRALYRLKERGVAVPDAPAEAAPGRSLASGALPILMAPPGEDDERSFTFAHVEGAKLTVVDARFAMPVGLELLEGQGSSRGEYLAWTQRMAVRDKSHPDALPQRARLESGMLDRKRWELRACLADRRLSDRVDIQLLKQITAGAARVPHPAVALATDGPRLGPAELSARPWTLAAFHHTEPIEAIRDQLDRAGGFALFRRGGVTTARRAAAEWGDHWGAERIRETLLDVAAFCQAVKAKDAARSLAQAAVDGPIAFLEDYVAHVFE